jgi:hypothetical protein
MPDEATIQELLEWEQSKRKASGRFDLPTQGFGLPRRFSVADISMTLWLPSPAADRKLKFVNGTPQFEAVESCLTNDGIHQLRDRILRSVSDIGPGLLSVDIAFAQYTAEVLKLNYDFDDDDLTDLLNARGWHTGMISHVCGGVDLLQAVSDLAPQLMPPKPIVDESPPPTEKPRRRRRKRGR